jgi:hypothetical protein
VAILAVSMAGILAAATVAAAAAVIGSLLDYTRSFWPGPGAGATVTIRQHRNVTGAENLNCAFISRTTS